MPALNHPGRGAAPPRGAIRPRWAASAGLVAAVTLLAHRALLSAQGFRTRDHFDFYARVGQYTSELVAGHYPQTLPDALRGGGHAFPVFYPPLAHLAAAGAHLLGADAILATHLTAALALVLSSLLCFWVVRRQTGSDTAALVAAGVYALFPYRFEQLQVRGVFAEAWVLVWLPLVWHGTMVTRGWRDIPWWWPASIAFSLLSHTVLSLWVLPLAMLAAALARPRRDFTPVLLAAALATATGVALAAFYLVPMWWHLDAVNVADPGFMRATAGQVAASGAWLFPPGSTPQGVTSALLLLGGLAAVAWSRSPRRDAAARSVAAVAAVLCLVLGLSLGSDSLWRFAPTALLYIQSPVRLLAIATLFAAVLAGLVWVRLEGQRPLGWVWPAAALAATAWFAGRHELFRRDVTASEVRETAVSAYGDLGFTFAGDYVPRGEDPRELAERIEHTRRATGRPPLVRWDSLTQRGLVEADSGQVVPLPLVGYWFHDLRSPRGERLADASAHGQLALVARGGPQEVVVTRRLSAATRLGALVSVLAVLALAWLVSGGRKRGPSGSGLAEPADPRHLG